MTGTWTVAANGTGPALARDGGFCRCGGAMAAVCGWRGCRTAGGPKGRFLISQDVLTLDWCWRSAGAGGQRLSYALSAERAMSDRRNASYDALSLSAAMTRLELGPAEVT